MTQPASPATETDPATRRKIRARILTGALLLVLSPLAAWALYAIGVNLLHASELRYMETHAPAIDDRWLFAQSRMLAWLILLALAGFLAGVIFLSIGLTELVRARRRALEGSMRACEPEPVEPPGARPLARPVFRALACCLFFLFVAISVLRLVIAISTKGFSWELLINLATWAVLSVIFFGIWRNGR